MSRPSIAAFFGRLERAGRAQASPAELARAGFSAARLASAVRSRELRQGAAGYWRPAAAPDPGAAMIFDAILKPARTATPDDSED